MEHSGNSVNPKGPTAKCCSVLLQQNALGQRSANSLLLLYSTSLYSMVTGSNDECLSDLSGCFCLLIFGRFWQFFVFWDLWAYLAGDNKIQRTDRKLHMTKVGQSSHQCERITASRMYNLFKFNFYRQSGAIGNSLLFLCSSGAVWWTKHLWHTGWAPLDQWQFNRCHFLQPREKIALVLEEVSKL